MREQFAGWGMYDHVAVCLTCRHEHLIPKAEQVSEQPWLDWLTKHKGHENFIIPHKLRSALGDQVALRHNADVKVAYASSTGYTCTLTGLATSSTLIAGRESTAAANTTDKYLDHLVAGLITVGTGPTANTYIEVWAVGAIDDATTWPDVFDGTDSAETISNAGIKEAICKQVAGILVPATTSDLAYPWAPIGIRKLFGDGLPVSHVLWVTHSTGVNLNATAGNQSLRRTPVYATVT